MDKSNHRVTVDRQYLEMLEDYHKNNQEVNIFGKVLKVKNPISNPWNYPQDENVMFLNQNELTNHMCNRIIVVDKEGREILRYRLTEKIIHD
jgi:hypothetical protein